MDYGKINTRPAKEKEAKRTEGNKHKEVRLSPTIDKHDLDVKKGMQRSFYQGDKVKVSIRFRGRQLSHTEIGRAIMDKFAGDLEELAVVERKPKMEGKSMIMIMSPK